MIVSSFIKSKIPHLPFYLLCLFIISLPFSINFSNILFVCFAVSAVFRRRYFKDFLAVYRTSLFLLFTGFYIIHIIGIAYSSNLPTGFFILEKELAIIVFPLVLLPLFRYFGKKEIDFALNSYLIGLLIAIIWLYYKFYTLSNTSPSISLNTFFRELAYEYVQLHPSYLCMYLAFGVFISIQKIQESFPYYLKLFYGLIALLFAGNMPLTGARLPLIAFLIILPVYLVLFLNSNKSKIILIIVFLILLPFLTIKLMEVPTLKSRIEEIKMTELSPPMGIHFNSINLRVAQILCSKSIISENWMFGVGTGDVQDKLNECYKENGWSNALYERGYNAHNQYIQTWLTLGIPGIVFLFTLIMYLGYISVKVKNNLFLVFILLFAFCCLTESMLEKNKGVMFFTCFSTLLSLQYFRKKLETGKDINKDLERAG